MQESKKIYNAVDLAKIFNIHPNTIWLYELNKLLNAAQKIPSLIEAMKTI